jgi:hypothetical protein
MTKKLYYRAKGRGEKSFIMVEVTVRDYRTLFKGRKDVLITPTKGYGEMWVAEANLKII